jgi:pyruvate dehydrogenase E2 component (dihydrolipoamide acetyltransferase)
MPELFAVEHDGPGEPVVLLHGFGGSHRAWDAVAAAIAGRRRTIAFDLPGHAGSLRVEHGSAAVAARALLAALERRGARRFHLAGHSMGGAAAAIAALTAPQAVRSLTLLAPGGFGPEINHRLLRRYAAATAEPEIALLLEQFFGWSFPAPAGLAGEQAREREAEGATAALARIVATFFDEQDRQRTIRLDELARLSMPVKVLWGTQDRVLPTRQAHKLPGRIAVHIFEDAGHMLPHEIPAEAACLILENCRAAG